MVEIGRSGIEPEEVVAVARHGEAVRLTPEAGEAMRRSRARVEQLATAEEPVYGISTGFGALAATRVPPQRRSDDGAAQDDRRGLFKCAAKGADGGADPAAQIDILSHICLLLGDGLSGWID